MIEIVIPSLYLLAGIVAYASVHHLAYAMSPPRDRLQMLFAAMCLFVVPFAHFSAQNLQAANAIEYIHSIKLEYLFIPPIYVCFAWFIALYTGNRPKPFLAGITLAGLIVFLANLYQPYSLQYGRFDGIRTLQLPWGEAVSRGIGQPGPLMFFATGTFFLIIGFVLYSLGSAYRREHRRTDLWMLFAFLLFVFSAIEGALARLSVIDFIELGPFGFLVVVIVMSVSLTRETQYRLRASEQNFRSLFENSPIGMVAIDPQNGRILQVNQIALKMIGYSAEEILTKTVADLTPPEDMADSRQRYEQLSKGLADHLYYERSYIRKDGSAFLGYSSISTMKDDKGNIRRFIGSTIDITERKLTENALRESEVKLRSLFELSPLGIALTDMDGRYVEFNESFRLICGYPEEELKALDYWTLTPKKYEADEARQLELLERTGRYGPYEKEYVRKDGSLIPLRLNGVLVTGRDGQKFIWSIVEDITEHKQSEAELRIAATAFESQEGILITDADSIILRVNQAFTAITGYAAEEAIGKSPRILSSGHHNANFYAAMWESLNNIGAWEGEIWNRRKCGNLYPEKLSITAVKDRGGIVTNYVATFTDITDSKAAEEKIKHLAFYDQLTELPNRRLLRDRLQHALASSTRRGRQGALLFIDLDDFKTLNDTLGHVTGDSLLQLVALRLASCVREDDSVARFGGDEFVVILEDLSENALEAAAQTEISCGKILSVLNQPYQLATHEYQCTTSIGATLFNGNQQTIDDLLKQADIAMYQAKKAGRNMLRFFDPRMQDTINARADLERQLHEAIENRQFHLYYQIQIDSSDRPLGAEALIRWAHPKYGILHPAEFIPLAEETGLILPIGKWVLETACAQLKEWESNELTRNLVLSVNISAKQFLQADFVAQIRDILQCHAIDPSLLELELTESMLLENIEETIATMDKLRKIGIRFSLDDFGTGYSSLQYLKRLPLDQLKIDQSFVRDITFDNSDKAIVSTIIAMAQSFDLEVIAEGVETMEQRQLLLNKGCTHFQGHLFSKPLPIAQFETILKYC